MYLLFILKTFYCFLLYKRANAIIIFTVVWDHFAFDLSQKAKKQYYGIIFVLYTNMSANE